MHCYKLCAFPNSVQSNLPSARRLPLAAGYSAFPRLFFLPLLSRIQQACDCKILSSSLKNPIVKGLPLPLQVPDTITFDNAFESRSLQHRNGLWVSCVRPV